jgi:calcineurin-like phosphoesterase family protein
MRYYIADCHFGHDKVRKLDKRPFETVEQMDAYMIERWNQVVRKKKDEVVILGDFCMGKGERVNELLSMLNGKKCLVSGNHDKMFLHDKKLDTSLFEWIYPYAELHDNNRKVILCHYPIICYNGQYRGNKTYMLYGHVHDTKDYRNVSHFVDETRETTCGEDGEKIPCNMINCFTVFSDYRPLSLDEWIARECTSSI